MVGLTAYEAEFVPALSQGLFFLGEVNVLAAARANSRHLDDQTETKYHSGLNNKSLGEQKFRKFFQLANRILKVKKKIDKFGYWKLELEFVCWFVYAQFFSRELFLTLIKVLWSGIPQQMRQNFGKKKKIAKGEKKKKNNYEK